MVELESVADIHGGGTPRRDKLEYWNGDIPWVTPTELPIPAQGIADVYNTREKVTEIGLASCSANLLPPGTVLFSSRASIGKIGIASVPLTTNQGFANLVPQSNLDSRFLAWCLHYNASQISRLAGSTTFKEVAKSALKRFRIPLPSQSEQLRIVNILDKANRLRHLRTEADAKRAHIIPALFTKVFGDPGEKPMGWGTKRFRELLTRPLRNGLSPSSAGTYPAKVLTLPAITGTMFDEMAVKDRSFVGPPPSNKKVDPRDFLICRGNGNLGFVGRARFPHRRMENTVFPDTIIAARVDQEQVNTAYLEAPWHTNWMRQQIESRSNTTSGIHKINQTTLGSLPVRLPPIALQNRFGVLSYALRRNMGTRRTEALDELFTVLSQRAFSGKLALS